MVLVSYATRMEVPGFEWPCRSSSIYHTGAGVIAWARLCCAAQECLNIFGGAYTSMRMTYAGYGNALTLMLEESGQQHAVCCRCERNY